MESKAQKAALVEIEKLKHEIANGNYYDMNVKCALERICEIIEEYELKSRIEVLESIYELLMKKNNPGEAASFAKKYKI